MKERSGGAPVATQREQEWDTVRALIRDLEEERDLQGLAAVAEMGLTALRQLCERPVTCQALHEMLEMLRGLSLDAFEAGEEQ